MEFLTAQEAWNALIAYRGKYYRKYIAPYSGDRMDLNATGERGSFWKRPGKAKIHLELAGDIAATSADLLFAEEPAFTIDRPKVDVVAKDSKEQVKALEEAIKPRQDRLDELISLNGLHGKLNEGAESCAALGDVYMKLNWWKDEIDFPVVTIVQGDSAWAEYLFGILRCIHFFSVVKYDAEKNQYIRAYERYEPGKITMALYTGTGDNLGNDMGDNALNDYGFERVIKTPVADMLAAHVPNMKPNRRFRDSQHGRSDFDGLRDQLDALDETYSSWMRDVRLAKARLIVPAEYLRRKPADMFTGDKQFTYEFDEDVETLVALDIDTDKLGSNPITASQFAIRADEHAKTCADLIRNIVSEAGYSPQTFGLDIEGNAQSGTALHIREKKSFNTRNKKQTYWGAPLEQIMTAMVHLDAALFPSAGSKADDTVSINFSDTMASDLSTVSSALEMINRAVAASIEVKVRMLHPDWTDSEVDEEVQRIRTENGLDVDEPDMGRGDYENPRNPKAQDELETEDEGGEA